MMVDKEWMKALLVRRNELARLTKATNNMVKELAKMSAVLDDEWNLLVLTLSMEKEKKTR